MAILDMKMKFGIHLGKNQFKWVPAVNTNFLPLDYITSKGGVIRGFRQEQDLINDMVIGDEFREAIQQQNLIFGRFSDNYSLDLDNARRNGQRLWVFLHVWANNKKSVSKRATLIMHNAQVTMFHREMAKGKNFERVKIEFPSETARIEYGDNLDALVTNEISRIMNDAANTVMQGINAAQIR